jgi:hypothetical protein
MWKAVGDLKALFKDSIPLLKRLYKPTKKFYYTKAEKNIERTNRHFSNIWF